MILSSLDLKDTDTILLLNGKDGEYSKQLHELINAEITTYSFDENASNGPLQIPLAANSFDKIILTEVIAHVLQENKAFEEIYRILKPGGIFVVTVPNHNFPFLHDPLNWIMQNIFHHPLKQQGAWRGHIRLYKPDDLRKKLEDHRFIVKEILAKRLLSAPSVTVSAVCTKK